MLLEMRTYFDARHGGPYDRGTADSWYSRGRTPHFFRGASYDSPMVEEKDMTPFELKEYNAGFDDNESDPNARKN